jgi:anaerobic selenocysteine-containing dehydrogenase
MLHVVLRDGLEDREFIAEHTTGFAEVAAAARAWDPETAARKTGVPPAAIEQAARWFAEAGRAIALHARGLEHQSKGVEIMEAIHRGEIKGLLSICFNPLVSLPDARFTREALARLEFFGVVDFFLSETAHFADVVLAGSLQEEEEGVVASTEGRVLHIQKAVDPPGDGRVLQGPPQRPLPRIRLARRGDDLIATGIDLEPES